MARDGPNGRLVDWFRPCPFHPLAAAAPSRDCPNNQDAWEPLPKHVMIPHSTYQSSRVSALTVQRLSWRSLQHAAPNGRNGRLLPPLSLHDMALLREMEPRSTHQSWRECFGTIVGIRLMLPFWRPLITDISRRLFCANMFERWNRFGDGNLCNSGVDGGGGDGGDGKYRHRLGNLATWANWATVA